MKVITIDLETSIGTGVHGPDAKDPSNDMYTVILGELGKGTELFHNNSGFNRILPEQANLALGEADVLVGHNLGFDLRYIWNNDSLQQFLIKKKKLWCTQVAEYLLTGQQHAFASLAELQEKYFGEKEKPSRISALYKKGVGADKILAAKRRCPRLFKLYEQYCYSDGDSALRIYEEQIKKAKALNMIPIIELYQDYLAALTCISMSGILIDLEQAERTMREFNQTHLKYLEEAQSIIAGVWSDPRLPEFNVNSGDHKSAALFGGYIKIVVRKLVGKYKNGNDKYSNVEEKIYVKGLGVPKNLTYKTKKEGVFATGTDVIEKICSSNISEYAKSYCIAQKEAMMYKKASTTYVKAFIELSVNGRIYPYFNNTLTSTGRLSSSKPNCVSADTEVLTPRGWVLFPELAEDDLVYQVDPITAEGSFVKPSVIHKVPNFGGKMISVQSENSEFLYTKEHRILSYGRRGENPITEPAAKWLDVWGNKEVIIDRKVLRSSYVTGGTRLSEEEKNSLELAVICQAEGYFRPKKTKEDFFMVKVKSDRKKQQLSVMKGVHFKHTRFCLHVDILISTVSRWVNEEKEFMISELLKLSREDLIWFLECVHRWDGDFTRKSTYGQKLSKRKQSLDVVQAIASLVGQSTSWYNHPTKDFAVVNFNMNSKRYQSRTFISEVDYNDYVYCVSVPSSYFLIRRNGAVIVTGNCQNVSKRNKFGKDLHKLFVAPEGWACVSIDFSQLEIWVMGWLSGDKLLRQHLQDGTDMHIVRLGYYNDKSYEELYKLCKIDADPYYTHQRTLAKTVSYQMAYGAGHAKVAESTGLPLDIVKTIYEKEAETYPNTVKLSEKVMAAIEKSATLSRNIDIPSSMKKGINGCHVKGSLELLPIFDKQGNVTYNNTEFRKIGYYVSGTGKRYGFLDSARDYGRGNIRRQFSFTQSKNFLMQGTGADIQGATTAELLYALLTRKDKIQMINEVHDSKWFYVKKEHMHAILPWLKKTIEDVPKIFARRFGIEVPFKYPIDIECGPNFAEMSLYTGEEKDVTN